MKLILEDITNLKVECIVNPTNETLYGTGGISGIIHKKGGKKLTDDCLSLGGCKTGSAKITKGYNLKAKYIIHTVGPIYRGKKEDPKLLESAYMESLNLAKKNNICEIAFPAISTGIFRYPFKEATKIAIRAVKSWKTANKDYNINIIFVCFNNEHYDIYKEELSKII